MEDILDPTQETPANYIPVDNTGPSNGSGIPNPFTYQGGDSFTVDQVGKSETSPSFLEMMGTVGGSFAKGLLTAKQVQNTPAPAPKKSNMTTTAVIAGIVVIIAIVVVTISSKAKE
jgi:hypothetical protein